MGLPKVFKENSATWQRTRLTSQKDFSMLGRCDIQPTGSGHPPGLGDPGQ